LIAAAIYAARPGPQYVEVIAAAAAGAIVGDNIGYWIGREIGFRLLVRYGSHVGQTEGRIKVGQYLFQRHGGKIVFFGRFIALLRVLAALLAGVNRMSWPRFFFFNAAGAFSGRRCLASGPTRSANRSSTDQACGGGLGRCRSRRDRHLVLFLHSRQEELETEARRRFRTARNADHQARKEMSGSTA
jgi:hypothetical protein